MSDIETSEIKLFEFKRGNNFSCIGMVKNMEFDCFVNQVLPDNCPTDVAMAFFEEAERAIKKKLEQQHDSKTS